jgi:hypothetical protein
MSAFFRVDEEKSHYFVRHKYFKLYFILLFFFVKSFNLFFIYYSLQINPILT